MRLGEHQQRAAAGRRGKQRPWPLVERSRHTIGAYDSKQHRQQAWQPVRGDIISAKQRRRGRLQPVYSCRLLGAQLVLEPDRDKVATVDHLATGLGKARLVAIHWRNGLVTGQDGQGKKCQDHQQRLLFEWHGHGRSPGWRARRTPDWLPAGRPSVKAFFGTVFYRHRRRRHLA